MAMPDETATRPVRDQTAPARGEGVVVVINSDAGFVRKQGPSRLRTLIRRLGPADLARVVTTDRHDLRALVTDIALGQPRVLAVLGGDGTAHCALEALTPLGIATAPLPGGTMNRLSARVFGRANLEQCMATLDEGAPSWLSGGRVGGYSFYVAAGFGAWMQIQSLRERVRRLRSLTGFNAVLRMAPRQFADRVTWSSEGGSSLDHSTLIVGVGRIDSAMGLARERHEPALFEAAGADIRNWRELAMLSVAGGLRRWRRHKGVASLATRTIDITSNHQGTPALFDGEFHMLSRCNEVIFDPQCGLAWRPAKKRAPW